jgi:hypothetical protein
MPDPEIAAITQCFEALTDLDEPTRVRVIDYLSERFTPKVRIVD